MTNAATTPKDKRAILSALRFRAEADPLGPAIALSWELPIDLIVQEGELPEIIILRRERRFPGLNRRGTLPREVSTEDLADGENIYDPQGFDFDFRETREERFDTTRIETTRYYDFLGESQERQLCRLERREFTQAPDGSETLVRATARVIDYQAVQPGRIYYYTAFLKGENDEQYYFSSFTQASALATGRYGHQLFKVLPQIHQRLDTTRPAAKQVTPADRDKGQHQRFLEVFEAHTDLLHGFVDGLRDLHNIDRVDSKFLPLLAHYMGWKLQGNLDEEQQRNQLRNAPELYKTIGTIPSIKAIINRFTGWDSRIHPYAGNVLLSFDASRLEVLENGEVVYLDNGFKSLDSGSEEASLERRQEAHRLPAGSIDVRNAEAMSKLRFRDFDDRTAYTYDTRPLGDPSKLEITKLALYNPKRIRIDIIPDRASEAFSIQEGIELVRSLIAEFLPINVEPVFVLRPEDLFEERYDTVSEVREELVSEVLSLGETFSGVEEEATDRIPGLQLIIANDSERTSADTTELPADIRFRTWHTALEHDI